MLQNAIKYNKVEGGIVILLIIKPHKNTNTDNAEQHSEFEEMEHS